MMIPDQLASIYDSNLILPDITCIGANDPMQGLLLGFDNGLVMKTASESGVIVLPPMDLSGDAVNGIAVIGKRSIAVSTRFEVSFYEITGDGRSQRAVFFGGAHGVVATNSGSFISPLGPQGLLIVRPHSGPEQKMEVTTGTEGKLYFYRLAALYDNNGKETLVFANRKQGIGFSIFNAAERRRTVHTIMADGIDIVDVCGVIPGSLCAAAVSTAGDLLWIQDSSKAIIEPVRYKLNGLDGVVYRVVASSKHLFVLTSKALYIWNGLVAQTINGRFGIPGMLRAMIPVDAVDLAIIQDQFVCLVMGVNTVDCYPISEIEKQFAGGTRQDSVSNLMPTEIEETDLDIVELKWSAEDVEQNDKVMVGAA